MKPARLGSGGFPRLRPRRPRRPLSRYRVELRETDTEWLVRVVGAGAPEILRRIEKSIYSYSYAHDIFRQVAAAWFGPKRGRA